MVKKKQRSIEAQEARIAVGMLVPAFIIVFSIVLFPVLLNLWVSFKPLKLGDLRAPTPLVKERVRVEVADGSNELQVQIRYQLRNSSNEKPIAGVTLQDALPSGFLVLSAPTQFVIEGGTVRAELGDFAPGSSEEYELVIMAPAGSGEDDIEDVLLDSDPRVSGSSTSALTSLQFTLDNYRFALSDVGIISSTLTTIIYAICGSGGAVLLGMCAALLVNKQFRGKGVVRGLLLFPYVAPIVAVAFVWIFLLDPISGTINALLIRLGIISESINFLSSRPTALLSSVAFDAWRYSPFCYLFVLARLKAIPSVLYESAEIDGAGALRAYWHITLPQIRAVLATIFILRFIWTFNRFDDIFLLTGGSAGTRTLPLQVYQYAFGASDIGAGSATSVILFALLIVFLVIFAATSKVRSASTSS